MVIPKGGLFSPKSPRYYYRRSEDDASTVKTGSSVISLNKGRDRSYSRGRSRLDDTHDEYDTISPVDSSLDRQVFFPSNTRSKSRSRLHLSSSDILATRSRDESVASPDERQSRSRSKSRSRLAPSSSMMSESSSMTSRVTSKLNKLAASIRTRDSPKAAAKRDHLQDEKKILKLITDGLWSHDPNVIEDVLNKLSNLMFTVDEELKTFRRDAIFQSGGHLAIVQAMRRNSKHKGIATQGCRALANSTWETSDFMTAIAAVGGIGVILECMEQFPHDELVQICAVCALRNLSSMKRIASIILERDGLKTVLTAMQTFQMNSNIQECCCWTIAHLCLDKDNKSYIEKGKCLQWIGAAVDNHPNETDVLASAKQASKRIWEIILA
ncbi:hypothetical protein FisN_20Hh042 [Fistulifera solaris]|uniref:LRRK2 ARM repeat domain-containing protein n=1 Tax=Fistulifera solaris TaxID=1519565 RepID=A0A1Z5KC42_FISSO|nr:hypothetical protein FisN_20Hh042 [Fistulifera solaris]|eukprot:GAX23839.1 hypothetical protein FisN_20Hh042 [Fistulifera solaris]